MKLTRTSDVRGIEGHVIDKAKAMDQPCGAVVSFIIGDAPGVLRRLHLLEQKGMIAFFDPKDIVQIVVVQGLDVRGIGTQTVFGDDELEVGMILAQLGHKAFGGIAFTIIFGRPIVVAQSVQASAESRPAWSGWMIAAPNI